MRRLFEARLKTSGSSMASSRRRALLLIAASACLALLAMRAASRASALVQKPAKRAYAGRNKMPAWAQGVAYSTQKQARLTAVGKAQHEFFWEGLGDEQDRAIVHAPHKKVGGLKALQTQMLFAQPARPFYEASDMGQGGDWSKYGQQLHSQNGGNPYAKGWAAMKPAKNMDQVSRIPPAAFACFPDRAGEDAAARGVTLSQQSALVCIAVGFPDSRPLCAPQLYGEIDQQLEPLAEVPPPLPFLSLLPPPRFPLLLHDRLSSVGRVARIK